MMTDSIKLYHAFKANKFTEEQAQLVVSAFEAKVNVATKDELYAFKDELKKDIGIVRTELYDVKAELKQDIADVRDELKDRIKVVELGLEKLSRKQLWTTFILIFTIIAVNPKSVEMILRAIGIIK